ncbi:hypothetical protein Gogos_021153 [Gossypium gossypioides]|uniref:DUF7745 domain-containing protein n=1 Tax=Gossypium gossypioides TaxID=34282 RepID=A0A7J9D4W1_GOSGO|nr:hypothetical protein [Gossypium gossypioides]
MWDFTRISTTQNYLQELKEICGQWVDEIKQLFYCHYALTQYWNPAYSFFTFRKMDLVPTIEEYIALLRCPKIQTDKVYSRTANVPTFLKKLMSITGMSEQWITAQIK